jgi:UDP-glucose 4-epimerase
VGGEVFNIACGEKHSLLEIAEIIGRFVGRKLDRKHVESRRGDVRHTLASIDRARHLLGYDPTVGFEDGLRKTFDAFTRVRA